MATQKDYTYNAKKGILQFSKIAESIWCQVETIRDNNSNLETGKSEDIQEDRSVSYDFSMLPFKTISNKQFPNKMKIGVKNYKPKENVLQIEKLDIDVKPLIQVKAKIGKKDTILSIDNGAQRSLMHPNLFKSIKKKCKTIPIVKDTVLQSVDGNELPEEGRFIIKNAISFENENPKDPCRPKILERIKKAMG